MVLLTSKPRQQLGIVGPMGGTTYKQTPLGTLSTTVQKVGRGYTVTRGATSGYAAGFGGGGGNRVYRSSPRQADTGVSALPTLPDMYQAQSGGNLAFGQPAGGGFARTGGGGGGVPGGPGVPGGATYDARPTPTGAGGVYADFERQQQEANQANRERMEKIERGYTGVEEGYAERTQEIGKLLEGYGEAQRERLGMAHQKQAAGLTQDFISRGMFATSALDAGRRAMERDQRFQQRQLEDQLAREKVGLMSQLSKEELDAKTGKLEFKERVEEGGPEMGDLQVLAQKTGEGQAPVPDYESPLGQEPQQPAPFPGPQPPGDKLPDPKIEIPETPMPRPAPLPTPLPGPKKIITRPGGGGGGGGGDPGAEEEGGEPGPMPPGTEPEKTPTEESEEQGEPTEPGQEPPPEGQPPGPEGEEGGPEGQPPPETPPVEPPTEPPPSGPEQPKNAPPIPPDVWDKLRGTGEPYAGGGVYVPGIPYPTNIAGMSWEDMKKTAPWPGSRTSEIRWRNYMRTYSKLFGGGDQYEFEAGSPTTY